MPKDMASKRIHGSDAWCAVHQLPLASLSVGIRLTHAPRTRVAGHDEPSEACRRTDAAEGVHAMVESDDPSTGSAGVGLQPGPRVHDAAVDVHLEVHVAGGGASGRPDEPDHLTRLHVIASGYLTA